MHSPMMVYHAVGTEAGAPRSHALPVHRFTATHALARSSRRCCASSLRRSGALISACAAGMSSAGGASPMPVARTAASRAPWTPCRTWRLGSGLLTCACYPGQHGRCVLTVPSMGGRYVDIKYAPVGCQQRPQRRGACVDQWVWQIAPAAAMPSHAMQPPSL